LEAVEINAALQAIPAAFGRPHVHSGLGMRQLQSGVYEVRVGLHLRAVFTRQSDVLMVELLGTHDQVRRYLRECS